MEGKRKRTPCEKARIGLAAALAAACVAAAICIAVPVIAQRAAASGFATPKGIEAYVSLYDNGMSQLYDGRVEIDWDYWQSVNPDIVGWVYIQDTHINYPVAQADKAAPTFYLYHDVYRNWNPYGAAYIDADCGVDSLNVIVYGHNMGRWDDEAMFSELAGFQDEEYASQHSSIAFITPEKKRVLNVRAVATTSGSRGKVTGLEGHSELLDWYKARHAAAAIKWANPADWAIGQVFVFTTCSYGSYNERTLIYALAMTARPAGGGQAVEK